MTPEMKAKLAESIEKLTAKIGPPPPEVKHLLNILLEKDDECEDEPKRELDQLIITRTKNGWIIGKDQENIFVATSQYDVSQLIEKLLPWKKEN